MLYYKTGTVEGTGVAISITVGFSPDAILLLNVDGLVDLWWTTDMGDGYGRLVIDSGSGATDLSFITSNGVTATDNGFSIGTNADINASGETIMWIAWRANE